MRTLTTLASQWRIGERGKQRERNRAENRSKNKKVKKYMWVKGKEIPKAREAHMRRKERVQTQRIGQKQEPEKNKGWVAVGSENEDVLITHDTFQCR